MNLKISASVFSTKTQDRKAVDYLDLILSMQQEKNIKQSSNVAKNQKPGFILICITIKTAEF